MSAGNDETEAALRDTWMRFKKCGEGARRIKKRGEGALRDQLILHYSPLVTYVARRLHDERLPNSDHADLFYCGTVGLIDAIEKFDLDRSIRFETYAISRIRGAIIDEFIE